MDQTQNRAVAALQPFLHLALTTKSPRMLADLITRATSAPGTYSFAELLHSSSIQSLRSDEHAQDFGGYLTLLEIFSYGTLADYKNTPSLPRLSPPQQHKLRLLTLLSIASEPNPLTYTHLVPALSLSCVENLESLVTEAIYSDLITARLSPTSTPPAVHITSIAPLRDVRPSSLPELLKVLRVWEGRCSSVIGDIEAQIAGVRKNAMQRKKRELRRQETVEAAVLNVNDAEGTNVGAGNLAGGADRATQGTGVSVIGHSSDENRRNKGIGSKRDLDEQQEDEVSPLWRQHQGGSGVGGGGAAEEDGDVGLEMARMEVDEPPSNTDDGGRTAKRVVGKKRL